MQVTALQQKRIENYDAKIHERILAIKVEVLDKEYWKRADICVIMGCSPTIGSEYMKKIKKHIKEVLKKDWPRSYEFPSSICIEVLGINEKSIRTKYKEFQKL